MQLLQCKQRKLPRTRSAEEICAEEKESNADDLKGYASDSTVSHPAGSILDQPSFPNRKNKKRGEPDACHVKVHKTSPSPPPSVSRLPPLNSGLVRMSSTGSILNSPDSQLLCESRESLLSDVGRHRRRSSIHRRPWRHEHAPMFSLRRRGSVDTGLSSCGACGGRGLSPTKPPLNTTRKAKTRDDSRHASKDKTPRSRNLSRSLKGEKERHPKASHHEENCVKKTLNRNHSFSSAGDYEGTRKRLNSEPNSEPIHSSTSGSKWIVYGFL